MKTLLRAAWVAPMHPADAKPVLHADWAVVFDRHRIIATGPAHELQREYTDAVARDLGNAIILPGLINAHVHLELTALGQLPRPANLVDWILALRQRMQHVGDLEAFTRRSVADGIAQCLRFGVTAVGDISLNPALSRPLLKEAGLRGVSFGEVLGMAGRSAQMPQRIEAAIDRSHETPTLRSGIEPHAPYSLDLAGYQKCLEIAREQAIPLATHLAETADEAEFLAYQTGAFRRLWEGLGGWNQDVTRATGGPIQALANLGLLDLPSILAHVNYINDDELDLLARGRASVVYCPRTHVYFNHPPHRFADMLQRGINVAIGTDSGASSPDLNLVDDLRVIYQTVPGIDPALLWTLITTRAARTLQLDDRCGAILPNFLPDLCVFNVTGDDPLREILEYSVQPREVWLGGIKAYAAAP